MITLIYEIYLSKNKTNIYLLIIQRKLINLFIANVLVYKLFSKYILLLTNTNFD